MTTIRIKGLDKLSDNIKKKLEDATKNKELLEDIGKLVVTQAKGFSRLGKQPKDEAGFKALKASTKKRREEMAKYNQTGEWYKGPDKSNLSFSGQLLDSITTTIDANNSRVTIRPEGQRTPYKNKDGSPVKSTPTNAELASYLSPDRPFLEIGPKTKKSIVNKIKSFLRSIL